MVNISIVLYSPLSSSLLPPFWFRSQRLTTAGQGRGRWAAGMSTLNGWPALLASSARPSPKTTCLPGTLSITTSGNKHARQFSLCQLLYWMSLLHFWFVIWFALAFVYFKHFVVGLLLSKVENRLQRRPRSTSMKDRQNSKAQSDRTSSMESECSPDSRLIAQVNHSQIEYQAPDWFFKDDVSFSDSVLLICPQRFPGSLCMTSWTRSSSLMNAYQRASSSSTPWSGKDRWIHLLMYTVETLRPWKIALLQSIIESQ